MNSTITDIVTWDPENEPDWMGMIDFDQFEKLAAVGYTPEKIAMFYKIPKIEFMYYYMLIDSKLKYHYDFGILHHEAIEGINMVSEASGNATQAQRLDKLRETVKFRNALEQIMYGGI